MQSPGVSGGIKFIAIFSLTSSERILKGQVLRKRYFLIRIDDRSIPFKRLEDDLRKSFNIRFKSIDLPYAIFLTDQFNKDFVSRYIQKYYPSIAIVSVSGTIRKLKSKICETTSSWLQ